MITTTPSSLLNRKFSEQGYRMKKKFKVPQLSVDSVQPTVGSVHGQVNGSTTSVVDRLDDAKTSKSNIW